MTEKKIFAVDRIEGEWAVCVSDNDDVIDVPVSSLGELTVRDIFSARIEGDALVDITPMPEERDRRLKKNRTRLHELARRSKK